MNNNYSLKRRFANVTRYTPVYPYLKAIYRQTLNRNYLLQRRKLINFYSSFVEKDDLVFDIGANVGDYTDAFLHLGARVCAVEPHPFCVQELKSLYSNNPQLIIIDSALGAAEGKGKMYLGEQGMHNVSTLSEEYKNKAKQQSGIKRAGWNSQLTVSIKTFDQLITEYGIPKFCKIDVEGFEYEVLKGLSQPLPMISLEYNPWLIDTAISCIEYISNLGSHEFNITMSNSRESIVELQFKNWLNQDNIIDLLNKDIRNTDTVGDLYVKSVS